jgi:lipopolysaccharide heptosyltransferase I
VKILIIKPSALGDIVQALPVATALRRRYPKGEIHWLVFSPFRELLEHHPAINQVVVWERRGWWRPQKWGSLRRQARQLREEHYDLVIDLQGLLRTGLLTWLTQAPRRVGLKSAREGAIYAYNEVVEDYPLAAAERYLEVVRYLGIEPALYDCGLSPRVPMPQPAPPAEYVVIHPYSQWRTKLWPWRYYQQLTRECPELHFLVVGKGPWFPLDGINVTDWRESLTLEQLITVLAGAKAVVSTDSGPGHLAAALGTPVLSLFGATDWRKTKPVGDRVAVETYAVFCSPCEKRICQHEPYMECMAGIPPQLVKNELWKLLSQPVLNQ